MIPEWLDGDTVQSLVIAAMIVFAAVAGVVLRFVRKMLLRLALVAVIAAMAASLWLQRGELRDCFDTCSCSLFAQTVTIPADKNPNCAPS